MSHHDHGFESSIHIPASLPPNVKKVLDEIKKDAPKKEEAKKDEELVILYLPTSVCDDLNLLVGILKKVQNNNELGAVEVIHSLVLSEIGRYINFGG